MKIIVDKLLDNQMRVFSNYKNLSNEKSLIQQFNALNQEMDLLQSQLLKANQLLNDTISEKCKHELIHHQQQQMMQQRANNTNNFNQTNKPTADSSNLFRANLVPVGNETSSNFTTNMHSLWRAMSPTNIKKQNLTGSSDNLANGVNLPIRNQPQVQQPQPQQQQNRNQPMNQYVSQVNGNVSRLNDISKSIDSIYSPSSSCSSNKTPNVTMSAFKRTTELASNADESCNSTSSKEKEIQISFQPINFTNSRPKPAQMGGMVPNKSTNFKRDFIAEKKRSSIGKYPQNYYVYNLLFCWCWIFINFIVNFWIFSIKRPRNRMNTFSPYPYITRTVSSRRVSDSSAITNCHCLTIPRNSLRKPTRSTVEK